MTGLRFGIDPGLNTAAALAQRQMRKTEHSATDSAEATRRVDAGEAEHVAYCSFCGRAGMFGSLCWGSSQAPHLSYPRTAGADVVRRRQGLSK